MAYKFDCFSKSVNFDLITYYLLAITHEEHIGSFLEPYAVSEIVTGITFLFYRFLKKIALYYFLI